MRNFIFYSGPSMLDGAPIVAIATASRNRKTGPMVQTWILRDDMSPVEASRNGSDISICGHCPHTGRHDDNGLRIEGSRSCYVQLYVPANIYATYKRNRYIDLTANLDTAATLCKGMMIRLGAYGDPAAVPFTVWTTLMAHVSGHTGYTHQFAKFPEFSEILMASCDNPADRAIALAMLTKSFAQHPNKPDARPPVPRVVPAEAIPPKHVPTSLSQHTEQDSNPSTKPLQPADTLNPAEPHRGVSLAFSAAPRHIPRMSETLQSPDQKPAPRRWGGRQEGAGRPSKYTPELAHTICERIADGETILEICRDDDMPDRETVRRWRMERPDFAASFAHARTTSAESLEDKALVRLSEATDKDSSLVARNLLEGIKWSTAKRNPDVYGEKITTDVRFSGSLSIEHDVTDRVALLMELQRKLGIDAPVPPMIEGAAEPTDEDAGASDEG